jgi:hypothetical protein
MTIDGLMNSYGDNIYYDIGFRSVLEDHIAFLKQNPQTRIIAITANNAYKYVGDYFGLLNETNITPSLHWLVMRMNDFTSPTENKDDIRSILVPDIALVERIKGVYLTQNQIRQ